MGWQEYPHSVPLPPVPSQDHPARVDCNHGALREICVAGRPRHPPRVAATHHPRGGVRHSGNVNKGTWAFDPRNLVFATVFATKINRPTGVLVESPPICACMLAPALDGFGCHQFCHDSAWCRNVGCEPHRHVRCGLDVAYVSLLTTRKTLQNTPSGPGKCHSTAPSEALQRLHSARWIQCNAHGCGGHAHKHGSAGPQRTRL
mmetsp:Transcript_16866/g.40109  ORF Transcript_16866/g.40109 Transcript_16866/m.40109 type:complete len:203 (-) Transcript_16866:310-918(-)